MAEVYLHYQEGKPVLGAPFYEAIGGRIRQARKTRNLTQADLAKATGLSIDRIRTFEKHQVPPNGQEILLICHHLDITPNWIYYGTDNPKHVKHIQNNLLTSHGYIDETDQLVRLALFFSVLSPNERRALEIILTSMVRGSGRSDEDIERLLATADTLKSAFSNNPFLNETINKLASDPDLLNKIQQAMEDSTPKD